MIISMTAFGRQAATATWGHAIWEIKTVNHRYLEMSIRLPEDLRMLENRVREQISAKLKRGKVDCNLRYSPDESESNAISINKNLADKIAAAAQSLQISDAQSINPIDILRWPGVINKEIPDPEIVGGPLLTLLDATLDILIDTRKREGEKIYTMILQRCKKSKQQVDLVRAEFPQLMDSIKQRIVSRANEIVIDLDNDRLEQEIVYLAQKLDVAEEIDRLDAHIDEVMNVLDQNIPVGRRLDFLMQEMNREANTLGSKAANLELSNASIELKVLIEQMREQIQNIE